MNLTQLLNEIKILASSGDTERIGLLVDKAQEIVQMLKGHVAKVQAISKSQMEEMKTWQQEY